MTNADKKGGLAAMLATSVIALLILYVLSYGPCVWLVVNAYLPEDMLAAYVPLRAVGRYLPAFNQFLNDYATWCLPLGHPPNE